MALTLLFTLFGLISLTKGRVVQNPCDAAMVRRDKGYLGDTNDCTRYYLCDFSSSGPVTPELMQCPNGLFWDQMALTCNFPALVTCPSDPCEASGEPIGYRINENCRQFYTCQNRAVPSSCCSLGMSFDVATGTCIQDMSCSDPCSENEFTTISPCNLQAVSGNQNVYDEIVAINNTVIRRNCAAGTAFDSATCGCSTIVAAVPPSCTPIVQLNFDGQNVMDSKGNWVKNTGVTVNNSEAIFDGNSFLEIPRFCNVPLGPFFQMRMRFRTSTVSVTSAQALVTNGDCIQTDGSVEITVGGDNITFTMRNESGSEFSLDVQDTDLSTAQTIIYQNSNNQFIAGKDGIQLTVPGTGVIGKSECSLMIGKGDGFNNFVGFVDLFEVFNCAASFNAVE